MLELPDTKSLSPQLHHKVGQVSFLFEKGLHLFCGRSFTSSKLIKIKVKYFDTINMLIPCEINGFSI